MSPLFENHCFVFFVFIFKSHIVKYVSMSNKIDCNTSGDLAKPYANTSVLYTTIFHGCKNGIFQKKK